MSDNLVPMTDDYVTEAQDYPPSLSATPPNSSAYLDSQQKDAIPSPLETYEGYGMLLQPQLYFAFLVCPGSGTCNNHRSDRPTKLSSWRPSTFEATNPSHLQTFD